MTKETTYANGYEFTTYTDTGTVTAKGHLQSTPAERNATMQAKAGGEARRGTDHGGHLVAARHNGPAIPQNLHAQDAKLNQGAMKAVENAESRAMNDAANSANIYTERIAYSSQPGENGTRPDAFMINDALTRANGTTDSVHLSFPNISPVEQEAMARDIETVDMPDMPNSDGGLHAQMTAEEYNEVMESTEKDLPSIKDEFDGNWSSYSLQSAEAPHCQLSSDSTGNSAEAETLGDWDGAGKAEAGEDGASLGSWGEGVEADGGSLDADADGADADTDTNADAGVDADGTNAGADPGGDD